MGTSANRRGPKPSIPLIPDWIEPLPPEEDPASEPINPEQVPFELEEEPSLVDDPADSAEPANPTQPAGEEVAEPAVPLPANRFNTSQRGFQKAVKTNDFSGLRRTVKNYVAQGLGGARTGARRLSRSGRAVASFGAVLGDIRQQGLAATLTRLNLGQLVGQPVVTVLSALMGHVCGVSALLDDAITREAYADTITRVVADMPNLDLEHLTEAQAGEMMAVFLEQSIVLRLICDIGRSQTVATADPDRSLRVQQELYQIVNGMVHSTILPELTRSMADPSTLNREIQRIYSVALNAILKAN
ncbi:MULTISPECIES: Qat anti-phage system associated protein QatB [Hymenobacter]|uniref:Uncharacterized protein n=1 Tax=Hymenobacter mucosus TaxID=1411120 RepID=A0A239BBU7_9BACT|nr:MULTISPECIES: Qat anti-phage system associated protein QatB [Hymenobacter]MDF7815484.1 hypothetical protein [Hymenobacter sp. YC55]SNS05416.1 hypothetical protein SAMN06269173_12118 [Hymenobacter mucosus]